MREVRFVPLNDKNESLNDYLKQLYISKIYPTQASDRINIHPLSSFKQYKSVGTQKLNLNGLPFVYM